MPDLRDWKGILGGNSVCRRKEESLKRKAFVYGFNRSPEAHVFVFVGADNASREKVIDGFARGALF